MLNRENFKILLDKYTLDKISPEEHSELFNCISTGNYDDIILQHIEINLQATNSRGANLPPHRSADILHKILSSEKQNSLLILKTSTKAKIIRWALAAAIFIAIAFSAFFLNNTETTDSYAALAKDMRKTVNTTDRPLKIKMEDGSMITLESGSAINFPAKFLPDKREIILEGEAFFEVSKNTSRPFFVYNKNIVTHVLGTSFSIKINKETNQVEVSVRSGRVEVYENKSTGKTAAVKKNNGVILLPNQKVIYEPHTQQFIPSLVDVPLPITDEVSDQKKTLESFVFEETPIKTVLELLQKDYGIDVIVDTENIYKCLFTGDISRPDLYLRLDIICQSIGASYEIKGTKILIKGKGCS